MKVGRLSAGCFSSVVAKVKGELGAKSCAAPGDDASRLPSADEGLRIPRKIDEKKKFLLLDLFVLILLDLILDIHTLRK